MPLLSLTQNTYRNDTNFYDFSENKNYVASCKKSPTNIKKKKAPHTLRYPIKKITAQIDN